MQYRRISLVLARSPAYRRHLSGYTSVRDRSHVCDSHRSYVVIPTSHVRKIVYPLSWIPFLDTLRSLARWSLDRQGDPQALWRILDLTSVRGVSWHPWWVLTCTPVWWASGNIWFSVRGETVSHSRDETRCSVMLDLFQHLHYLRSWIKFRMTKPRGMHSAHIVRDWVSRRLSSPSQHPSSASGLRSSSCELYVCRTSRYLSRSTCVRASQRQRVSSPIHRKNQQPDLMDLRKTL